MGSLLLGTFENIGEAEKRVERVEGGPLIVVDDSASALIYACLCKGNFYSSLVKVIMMTGFFGSTVCP